MALGKRLINTGAAAADVACSTDSVQAFGADNAFSSNIALYQLDGNDDDTTTNYDGTSDTGVTYSATGAKFGQAASFNGSNSVIILPSLPITTSSDVTFSAWIKGSSDATDATVVSTLGENGLELRVQNSAVRAVYRKGSSWYGSSSVSITADAWNHVVLTYEKGVGFTIYVNNTPTIFVETGTLSVSGSSNTIGRYAGGTSGYFDGSIDQVRIFDKAISAEDVATLYAETESTASNTNPFSEGSGVALYTMDYDASEASGYYDGTPTNVEFGVGGQINYGARFNGSSSYINLPNLGTDLSGSNTRTLSAWVKLDSNPSVYSAVVSYGGDVSKQSFGIYISSTGTPRISYYNLNWDTSTSLTLGDWYHIVGIYKGGNVETSTNTELYINGQIQTLTITNSIPLTGAINTSNTNYAIGYYRASPSGSYFNGDIDQVRLFSKGLSSDEVSTLYAETACVYDSTTGDVNYPFDNGTNVEAYYKLDNSSEDYVGGNDGTDTNVEYRFGRFGQAAVFNGSSSQIDLPNVLTGFTNIYSFSIWAKIPSTGNFPFFSSTDLNISSNFIRFVLHQNGNYYFDFGSNTSGRITGATPSEWRDGNWHNFVFVSTSTQKLVYVDGTLFNSKSSTESVVNQSDLTVGHYFNNWSAGEYDQVRIYSTALSSSQVTELYNEKPEVDTSNFKTVLYEGNDAAKHFISNVGFDLDVDNGGDGGLVWVKNRDANFNHILVDSIRGENNLLFSDTTSAALTSNTTLLSSLEKTGFIVGYDGTDVTNGDANDYVAWVWKGGGDDVLNEVGDIDSQVSANTEAGFSIVKWTGNNLASQTIGHGLSSTPEITIIKKLTGTTLDWQINLNSSITGTEGYFNFNTAALYTTFPNYYTSANSTVISTNGTTTTERQYNNQSADYIAYCWHSVAGYSKMGSYTGTGNAGNAVTTGFRPRFILAKKTTTDSSYNHWMILDSVRSPSGSLDDLLLANLSNLESAQSTNAGVTLQSNGFTPYGGMNNTVDYIYMAFK